MSAEITLRPSAEDGLSTRVEPGNRSLLFTFARGGEHVQLGAVIEEIEGTGEPGETFSAKVWFWSDVAAIYAIRGAQFSLWYGKVVGSGLIMDVLPDW